MPHNTVNSLKHLTVCAALMALVILFSSFGIPVPGGHVYLNDLIIVTAAILLDPLSAMLVGGLGAFLGDFFFYPTPMFVSLVTHGVQALLIALCVRYILPKYKDRLLGAMIGATLGAVVMVAGYTLGRAYIYANPPTALLKLPYQILQAAVGAVGGVVLCYPCRLRRIYQRL